MQMQTMIWPLFRQNWRIFPDIKCKISTCGTQIPSSRAPLMAQSDYNQIMDFLGRDDVSVSDTSVYLVSGNVDTALKSVPASVEHFFKPITCLYP